MRQIRSLSTMVAMFVMVGAMLGCAATQGSRNFNDYAGDVLQTANNALTISRTLYAAKKIDDKVFANTIKAAETAREGVAVARGLAASQGQASGTAYLRTAAATLESLNAYLLERQRASP